MSVVGVVSELRRFPVKSMLGEVLDTADVDGRGLRGDRAHAVVDRRDGKVASAKHPRKWGRLLELRAAFVDAVAAGSGAPLPPVGITFPDGRVVRSDSPVIDSALSTFLGREVTLRAAGGTDATYEMVWPTGVEGLAPPEFVAATTVATTAEGEPVSDLAPALAAPGTWFDLAALHLLTTATLAALRRSAPAADIHPDRFRPTIVVDAPATGFVEDAWVQRTLALGATCEARVDMPTMRCVMTTLAQGGRAADREVLRAVTRSNRREIPGLGTWACAGVYATVTRPGRIHVGDTVDLRATA
jgi:uncharacterized protein YcbX